MTGKSVQISNGLKAIGANIVGLANKNGVLEFSVNGVTKSVDLLDSSTGDLRSTFDVLKDVSESWNEMSKAEQTALGLALSGKTRFNVFTSVLSNFNTAIEANATALNSSGSAMKENARQAESIKSKINAVRTEFESLVLGSGGLEKFIKSLLDGTAGLLKFVNATGLLKVALVDIGIVLATILIPKFATWGSSLLTTAGTIAMFTMETGSLKDGLKAVGIQVNATKLAISGLMAVVSIGIMAWSAWITAQEQAKEQAKQNADESFKQADSINKVIEKLKDENVSREELVSAIDSVKSKYEEELSAISDVNELRKRGIDLLKQESDEKIRSAQASIASQVTDAKARTSSKTSLSGDRNLTPYLGNPTATPTATRGVAYQYNFKNLEEQTEALQKATEEARRSVEAGKEQQSVLDKLNDLYNKSKAELDEYNALLKQDAEYTQALIDPTSLLGQMVQGFKDNIFGVSEAVSNSNEALADWFNDLDEDELADFSKALKLSTDEFIENASAMGLSMAQYATYATQNQEIQDVLDGTSSKIDGLQSALGVAKQAWEEYSEGGSLTLDTFQSLLAISPEYLSALINENGQISVNQDTLSGLVEQLKIAKIEELQNAAAADILALANGNIGDMSDTAKGAVSNLGDNVSSAGDEAQTATGKMLGFASSVLAVVNASKGSAEGGLPDNFEANQKAILDAYQGLGDKIAGISVNTTKNVASGAKKGAGASKKEAKSTTDVYKEEYQKQLDALDHKLAMEEISEQEYYDSLQELNEKYFGVASGQQQKYLDEYQKNQEKIYAWQKKQQEELLKQQKQTYDKAIDYIKSNLQKKADLLKKDKEDELNDIDERIDYMEKKRDKEIDRIEDKIDALKEEKDTFVDNIESQIDILDKLKDKEEADWDAKISAYKEQNELLKEQTDLQKLQEALARAKSTKVKVFKGGEFVYSEDEGSIEEAQQNLDDYYTELKQQKELDALESARDSALKLYEEQINSLKEYKETMSKQYDEQIDNLEKRRDQIQEYYDSRIEDMKEYRDEVEEEYDAQIEILDNYIENFEEMVNSYDEEQNRLALVQLKGAEAENQTWMMRLENLKDFVNEYNRLQKELDGGSTNNEVKSKISGSASKIVSSIKKRASGDSSVKSDGLTLVGDKPNQELIIGGKLNGSPMQLSKGDGVVNAKSTNTLAGILNSLPSGGFKNYTASNNSGSSSNNLLIDKLYVQADNAMQFMDSMSKQFKIRTKQGSFEPV